MAIAFVQTTNVNTGGTGGSPSTSAFGSNVTAGSWLLAVAGSTTKQDTFPVVYGSGTAVLDVGLESMATIDLVDPNDATVASAGLYLAYVVSGGSLTLSCSPGIGLVSSLIAQEFSGLAIDAVLDVHAAGTHTISGGVLTTDAATTNFDDLIIGWYGGPASSGLSSGAGFSNLGTAHNSSVLYIGIESLVQGSPASKAATFGGISGTFRCGMAGLKPAGSAGTFLPRRTRRGVH